ncbi:MAG: sulfatase-like hydrolase/transferase, partial [Clostridia bacterium]|nr:sulfatase-like hydrolase/transferase [Clostridia bacterium]
YENRDTNKPYFVFNVTMQNHGSYSKTASNFNQEVELQGMSKEYPLANQYLSLVKRSDDAFKELIDYFSKVEEPVVICMFGDHQPSIEVAFVEEVMGKSVSSLNVEEEQKRHMTPFYIWANYDIEEQEIERLSANYLSSLVLKTAGAELTDYNKYLLELSKTLPVIDTVGYIDSKGNNYSWNTTSEYTDILKKYEYIQHNNVFDKSDKKEDLFYLK